MFTTESSVLIRAPAERVWEHVSDLEQSWPPSNPEHVETRVLSEDKRLREGLRYFDRERVGGVEARMVATVHDVVEARRFRWRATAHYRVAALHVPVEEGGTFQLEPVPEGTRVSHAIWARFPDSGFGRAAEWISVHLLRSERAARWHNRVELEHFKRVLEGEPTPSPDVGEGAGEADLRVSAHLEIAAAPEAVWALLSDPERWWVASNPEDHESWRS